MLPTVFQDVVHALRLFSTQRWFALGVAAILALAIGANAIVFALVHAVLLQPLPFRDPGRLVWIWSTRTDRDKAFFSIPDFIDHQQRNRTLAEMGALTPWSPNLSGFGQPERFSGIRVTGNALQLLGAKVVAGRLLQPVDALPTSAPAIVLGFGVWTSRFGADPDLIGRTIKLNEDSYRVVGVMDRGFLLPTVDAQIIGVITPLTDPRRADRGANFLRAFARLKADVTAMQAQADLDSITRDLRDRFPLTNAKHTTPRVLPLHAEIIGDYGKALTVLLAAVGLLLLVGCSNIANLLLARGVSRRKEIAIRTALGASRARLLVQALIESLFLAIVGASLGLLLANFAIRSGARFLPADLPRAGDLQMDGAVIAATAALTMVTTILCGLLPALQLSRSEPIGGINSSARGSSDSASAKRIRSMLVVTQVSLSFVLLACLGLFLKSFRNLQSVDPGFEPRNKLQVRLSLPKSRYATRESFRTFITRLEESLKSHPEVRSIAASTALPLSGLNFRNDFTLAGKPPSTLSEMPAAQYRVVTPGYFETLGIKMIRGREFSDGDDSRGRAVAIIDDSLAKRYFSDLDPIGAGIHMDGAKLEVIGVARSVKYFGLHEDAIPTLYVPMYQAPLGYLPVLQNGISIVVRTAGDERMLMDLLRRAVQSVENDAPATSIRTMDASLDAWLAPRRFNLVVLDVFGLAALFLAAFGLYAVTAFTVSRRAREMGIRSALGASRSRLIGEVLRGSLALVGWGIVIGASAAAALAPLISRLLFRMDSLQPAAFLSAAGAMVTAGLVASIVPARRAANSDAATVLRLE